MLAIAHGVAAAAAQLHQRGIVHGDLYAHNILHDAAGHCDATGCGPDGVRLGREAKDAGNVATIAVPRLAISQPDCSAN